MRVEHSTECPVCGVTITESGKVQYHYGRSRNEKHLLKRVCQYAKDKQNCINSLTNQSVGEKTNAKTSNL